jgi:hypothetical protein
LVGICPSYGSVPKNGMAAVSGWSRSAASTATPTSPLWRLPGISVPVWAGPTVVRVSGPHPGFEEAFDFCGLLTSLIG